MGEEKSNVVITEEGALSVKKLTFWEAAMIIVGANIGAGILGLAYSSRKAGWPILLMWLIIAGVFTTVSMLYVAETTLRTKKPMQLPGLAERYVGKLGAVLVFISVCANSIGCMISYTSGSGEILAELLGISPTLGSLIFTVPAVVVVWLGLKATGLAVGDLHACMGDGELSGTGIETPGRICLKTTLYKDRPGSPRCEARPMSRQPLIGGCLAFLHLYVRLERFSVP